MCLQLEMCLQYLQGADQPQRGGGELLARGAAGPACGHPHRAAAEEGQGGGPGAGGEAEAHRGDPQHPPRGAGHHRCRGEPIFLLKCRRNFASTFSLF